MGQLSLEGSLTGGPAAVSDSAFPASTFLVALGFAAGRTKQFAVASGVLTRTLASPGAFATLTGLGAADSVTKANALYFKCNADMQLQLTFDDGLGGNVVAVVSVAGTFVLETSDTKFLKGLACKGTGPIEYLVAGPS